jgi:hypothetical protein
VFGDRNLTLPSAIFKSQHRVINNSSPLESVTVQALSGETIEGTPQVVLTDRYNAVTFVANGVDLWVEV